MPKQVERRRSERGEGHVAWSEEERKSLLKLGELIDKWQNRNGKQPEKKKERHALDVLLGVSEE